MGRRSVKENKTMYQMCREAAGLTREAAAELTYIGEDRIRRIENGSRPVPREVELMAKAYQVSSLCNHYCTHECELGKDRVPMVKSKSLPEITLEMLAILNKLSNEKERLIEIAYDGEITDDETEDFRALQEKLSAMAAIIASLQLWVDDHLN